MEPIGCNVITAVIVIVIISSSISSEWRGDHMCRRCWTTTSTSTALIWHGAHLERESPITLRNVGNDTSMTRYTA